jgi:hypothetical protein
VQEQLLGFINEEVIPPTGRHHIAKFVIGQESPPSPSPLRKRNLAKKNQRGDSSVNKKSNQIVCLIMWFWICIVHT